MCKGLTCVSLSIHVFPKALLHCVNYWKKDTLALGGGCERKKTFLDFASKNLAGTRRVERRQWFQRKLGTSVMLNHLDTNSIFCIHTDASDRHWAVCATQCHPMSLESLFRTSRTNEYLLFVDRSKITGNRRQRTKGRQLRCFKSFENWITH